MYNEVKHDMKRMFRPVPETAGHKMRQKQAIADTIDRQRRDAWAWETGVKRIVCEQKRHRIN